MPSAMQDTESRFCDLFATREQARSWVLSNFDETNLSPVLTKDQLTDFILKRGAAGFKHICIPFTLVGHARTVIRENNFDMGVATVIGFPHGNESSSEDKKRQIATVAGFGAQEVDVVLNISLLRSDVKAFQAEIRLLVDAAHTYGMKIKAIFETYYLSNAEVAFVAQECEVAGVDFVKTSTGFGAQSAKHPEREPDVIGASPGAIAHMGQGVHNKAEVGIKPSGGIRTWEQTLEMLRNCVNAGWSLEGDHIRIGSSAGLAIYEIDTPSKV